MNLPKEFVIYAHRGASEYYPGNTLSSFYAGLEMGADGIETDIWRTKDGILVIWHDEKLEWKTPLCGSIPDYTYSELLQLTFRNEKYPHRVDKMPTLEEFCKYFGWRDLTFAIELKQAGIAAEVIAMLNKYSMKDKTFITSFNIDALTEAHALGSGYRLGYLYPGKTNKLIYDRLAAIEAVQACPKAADLTAEELSELYVRGYHCRAWGVSDESLMKKMVDMGVDSGMTVNFPDKLIAYCKGDA